ncbi:MAG: hypothetical protein ITG02_15395 [Patulibacter sp.]|nr:hypothetical protein [Patulibacter sp.]
MSTPTTYTIEGHFGSYSYSYDHDPSSALYSTDQSILHETNDERFIYKQYSSPRHNQRDRLLTLAQVGQTFDYPYDPTKAAHAINWPYDFISKEGTVVGVVLRRAPQQFLRYTESSVASSAYVAQEIKHLQFPKPTVPRHRYTRLGPAERVTVIRSLTRAVATLARHQLVHADLKGENVLWGQRPGGHQFDVDALVIDCDGLYREGTADGEVGTTSGWKDPRVVEGLIPVPDVHSDAYALALIMYRVFLARRLDMPHQDTDYGPIPAELEAHFRCAFDQPLAVDTRPSASDWEACLARVFWPDGRPDVDAFNAIERVARPSDPILLRGARRRRRPQAPISDPRETGGSAAPPALGSSSATNGVATTAPVPAPPRATTAPTSSSGRRLGLLIAAATALAGAAAIGWNAIDRSNIPDTLDPRQKQLAALLSPTFVSTCQPHNVSAFRTASTIKCADNKITISYSLFPTKQDPIPAFEKRRKSLRVKWKRSGTCADGPGRYSHRTTFTSERFSVMCYSTSKDSVRIDWASEQARVFGSAVAPKRTYSYLYDWWSTVGTVKGH